jgi:Neocarzinostatin family
MAHWRGGRLAVAVLVAGTILVGGAPAGAAEGPTARVSPSTDLVDQQRVRVRASRFPAPPAENRIAILQCVAEATDLTGCGDFTAINVTTDARGSASAWYRVSRVIVTPASGQVDCATSAGRCVIVVASLDGSQVVSVPISFDPAVPPLPPVDIEADLASVATVHVRTGTARLRGSVTCTTPTGIRATGILGQTQGDTAVIGTIDATVRCTGADEWSVRVRPNTPGARFEPGTGLASVTLSVDRSGPRDRVELFNAELPLVPGAPR